MPRKQMETEQLEIETRY